MVTKLEAFSVPLFECDCPEPLVNRMAEYVKTLPFKENQYNNLQDGFIKDKELIDWFNTCLDDLTKEIFGEVNFRLRVVQSWATKNKFSEYHGKHRHPNSIYSGILYLNTHNKKGETYFKLPNPWFFFENESFFMVDHKQEKEVTYTYKSVKGKMILFPSVLFHGSNTNIQHQDRYIIGFNSFFDGNVGSEILATELNVNSRYI